MPIVTNPPIIIDPVTFSRQSRQEENPFLIQHGGLQYQVLVPGLVGSNSLGVFLSQDDGLTWTELDSANKPTGTPRAPNVFYDSVAGTLEILYQNTTGHAIVTFTLAGLASTYGVAGATLTDAIGGQAFFAKKSSNTYVMFVPNIAGDHIAYYTNAGGVWSGPTDLIAGTFTNSGTGVKGGALSSTDVSFFATIDNSNVVKFHRVTDVFAVTSDTQASNGVSNRYTVKLDEVNDTAFIAWNGNQEVYVSRGTPLSAPVYTTDTIFSQGGSSTVSYPALGTSSVGDTVVFFVQLDAGVTPVIDLLWLSTFDGVSTWDIPVEFYDAAANPPANSAPNDGSQFIHTGDVVTLSSGDYLYSTAMETVDSGVDHCTGFVLIGGAPAPTPGTLTLQKIIGPGLQAVTTDFTLTATGPETVSGAGSVGPVSVTAGTYALSETSLIQQYISHGFVCTGGTQVGQDITIASGDVVVCTILNDPVVISAGGRGFIKFDLNFFNACLGREYLLYKLIDRELLKCGVKPYCFCIDERDWGGNFSEHEEVPMGPPEGALAFNPTGQVALPAAATGDVTIFTFRIPWGYDGVILGQYHGYFNVVSAPPVPTFVEGSGDITWRLSVAGRFGRDTGNMLVSLGSVRNMSPIAGGLQVRSENIIQYIVAAPNTSGALTPGLGNIIAGLHGWLWPRR